MKPSETECTFTRDSDRIARLGMIGLPICGLANLLCGFQAATAVGLLVLVGGFVYYYRQDRCANT